MEFDDPKYFALPYFEKQPTIRLFMAWWQSIHCTRPNLMPNSQVNRADFILPATIVTRTGHFLPHCDSRSEASVTSTKRAAIYFEGGWHDWPQERGPEYNCDDLDWSCHCNNSCKHHDNGPLCWTECAKDFQSPTTEWHAIGAVIHSIYWMQKPSKPGFSRRGAERKLPAAKTTRQDEWFDRNWCKIRERTFVQHFKVFWLKSCKNIQASEHFCNSFSQVWETLHVCILLIILIMPTIQ